MRYIEIAQLDNGAHENFESATEYNPIPDGYAVIPSDMETPNFPFGDIEVSEQIVTKWTALPMPEPEPVPYEESELDQIWEMEADHEERLCLLELGITEL